MFLIKSIPTNFIHASCILVLLTVISLLISSCEQERIAPESFGGKTIILEKNALTLDPGQSEEIFIGIENSEDKQVSFSFFVSCIMPNCEEQIISQFFPTVTVEPHQKIAVPFLIAARETALKGVYQIQIMVKKGDAVVGEELLSISILNTVEEKKQQLTETS